MARKRSPLKKRLEIELESVGKTALRAPKTWKEVATRARWDRLKNILWRRYEK
tara:strand:- start:408 stop:566 length:159 start_codon:yes stop_codon:yes gene_type:complete